MINFSYADKNGGKIMIERKSIKTAAKMQLKGNMGLIMPAVMIGQILGNLNLFNQLLIEGGIQLPYLLSKSMDILGLLLGGVMLFGTARITLGIVKKEDVKISDLFSGFSIYLKILALYITSTILTMIGTYFYIIPGLVISIMFSQAFYILAENEDESIIKCLIKSEKMMRGHKREFLYLELSFIGWILISILTFGIALFWLEPYMQMTFANYYLKLKEEHIRENNDEKEKINLL